MVKKKCKLEPLAVKCHCQIIFLIIHLESNRAPALTSVSLVSIPRATYGHVTLTSHAKLMGNAESVHFNK